jgi:hypothetical protein
MKYGCSDCAREMTQSDRSSDRNQQVLARLREYSVQQKFEDLVRAGAEREQLLKRLQVLSNPPRELQRLSKRTAKSFAQEIRQTADRIEQLNSRLDSSPLHIPMRLRRQIHLPTGFGKAGWEVALTYREILCLPEAMREYASRVEKLPNSVEARWKPIQTAVIAQLVWFVKESTKNYHDEKVSALIGAILWDGKFSADALKLWRSRHSKEIDELGPLTIFPYLLRPPRSR